MALFRKILVANRGEIAVRVISACQKLGIGTVAVASQADRGEPHTLLADEVCDIGGPRVSESYLNLTRIISAAQAAGADAIHPGYGLFAENAAAARQIVETGLQWIGPPPDVIALIGDKVAARRAAVFAGLRVVDGTESLSDPDRIRAACSEIGYPVVLKPAAGGGGIGMSIVGDGAQLEQALKVALRLSMSAFGRPDIYVERYVPNARHVEVQVAADNHGGIIHLGERECTVQRRHQKLVEEAPCCALDSGLREAMCAAAVQLTKAVGYRSIGTVEFLVSDKGDFFFSEMNARVQVEHPVTEMVTDIDLVAEQITLSCAQPLSLRQHELHVRGHAIECRIYAEDFRRNFLPSVGTLVEYVVPSGPGIRIDSGVHRGSRVTIYYDPMLCKVIVWGVDRTQAMKRMQFALSELSVDGVTTTRDLHLRILSTPEFQAGRLHTRILEHEWLPRFLGETA